MRQLHLPYHIARADFLERARRYSFLITLGLTIFAACLYVPPQDANYLTLGLGNYMQRLRSIRPTGWMIENSEA